MKHLSTFLAAAVSMGAIAYGCSSSSGNTEDAGDGGNGGGSGGQDGTTNDVSQQDSPNTGDDGGGGDDGGNCSAGPASLSGWTPPAYIPAKSLPGACQGTDIDDFDTNCLAQGHMKTNCDTWKSAHTTCASCLVSMSTDNSWGPLVEWPGVYNINVGGCIELTAPDMACETAEANSMECGHKACDGPCPVTDSASFMAWQGCLSAANMAGCMTYYQATSCATIDSGAGYVCNLSQYGMSFDSVFKGIAPVFCGGSADGGSSDASSDVVTGG